MKKSQHAVYLGLGSNLGDCAANLSLASEKIKHLGRIVKKSSIYETEPWGFKEQPAFLNQVLQIRTTLEAGELLTNIKIIEKDMGRIKTIKNGPRIIDIDILFFDDLILKTDLLTIPHQHILHRAFVLVPLNEIAPKFIHPLENKTIHELLEGVNCKSVWLWKERK